MAGTSSTTAMGTSMATTSVGRRIAATLSEWLRDEALHCLRSDKGALLARRPLVVCGFAASLQVDPTPVSIKEV
jgi:hypothetical protein